jgi:hypothetical protein
MTGETKNGAQRARSYGLGASGLQGPGSAPLYYYYYYYSTTTTTTTTTTTRHLEGSYCQANSGICTPTFRKNLLHYFLLGCWRRRGLFATSVCISETGRHYVTEKSSAQKNLVKYIEESYIITTNKMQLCRTIYYSIVP